MSDYVLQIQATKKFFDQSVAEAEKRDIQVLASAVPGGRLNEGIYNPSDSGIDQG